jgi:hypothetical protein
MGNQNAPSAVLAAPVPLHAESSMTMTELAASLADEDDPPPSQLLVPSAAQANPNLSAAVGRIGGEDAKELATNQPAGRPKRRKRGRARGHYGAQFSWIVELTRGDPAAPFPRVRIGPQDIA